MRASIGVRSIGDRALVVKSEDGRDELWNGETWTGHVGKALLMSVEEADDVARECARTKT